MGRASLVLVVFACLALAVSPEGSAQKPPVPAASGGERTIHGAGATFPYPLYAQWAYQYNRVAGLRLNYQSIGSGGGIAQIKQKTVDFGASDAPLKKEQLDEAGLVQFPMILGGVIPVVNLEGVPSGKLRLTPGLLSDLFLGKITRWNDAAIRKVNPDLALPDQAVSVVHRADGSGTTWIFTNYLSKVSPEWKEKVGNDTTVSWPTGVAGKGNEGVAAYVRQIAGSIGYVEYAYALQNQMTVVQLENAAGKFVAPTIDSFQAAAANADWAGSPGFYVVLTHQPGESAWPITGASFILLHREQPDAAKAREMLKFFDWCYRQGGESAKSLHYVPLPESVWGLVEKLWQTDLRAGGKPIWP